MHSAVCQLYCCRMRAGVFTAVADVSDVCVALASDWLWTKNNYRHEYSDCVAALSRVVWSQGKTSGRVIIHRKYFRSCDRTQGRLPVVWSRAGKTSGRVIIHRKYFRSCDHTQGRLPVVWSHTGKTSGRVITHGVDFRSSDRNRAGLLRVLSWTEKLRHYKCVPNCVHTGERMACASNTTYMQLVPVITYHCHCLYQHRTKIIIGFRNGKPCAHVKLAAGLMGVNRCKMSG